MLSAVNKSGCKRSISLLPRFKFEYVIRYYTSKEIGKQTQTQLKFTEDSDFAFRKDEIKQLSFAEQDIKFYPTFKSCIESLTEGISTFEKLRIPEFRTKYSSVTSDNINEYVNDPIYIMNGKIKSIRRAGKGSIFIDVYQDFTKVQFIIHHKIMNITKEEFIKLHNNFKPGDQIFGIGKVGITKVGELSLKLIKPLKLASPSLHPIPPKFNDIGKINQNRIVDYLVNKESVDIILLRSQIIKLIREFLENKGFLSIETPIICNGNSGANATPFETNSKSIEQNNDENIKLNLRVAPELWLKKLIIGGFDKIYEIGKVFRNEGIDSTHNPEFTTCEFYQTFIDLEELMKISEDIIIFILNNILKDKRFNKFHENSQELIKLINNNGGHFKKIEFLNELKNQTGIELKFNDLNKDGLIKYWNKIGNLEEGIIIEKLSESELINKLSEKFIEPLCKDNIPTFIYNIPEILSPLSKSNSQGISYRFEMFINGCEYINAYEEENNPFKQEYKFLKQLKNRQDGDLDSLIPDHKFVEFMEWGMPPTGGWGLGIDRLVMKLSNSSRIEQVLPFGKLNDVIKQ
jgi:lysyl-tRNA synthetase class 2